MGNGEWGMGNGERGMGNGERGMGNGEWGTGNGEWGMGKREAGREGLIWRRGFQPRYSLWYFNHRPSQTVLR